MHHIISAACGLWLCFAASALAQSQPVVVVELYTSQGCSSCPAADDFFATLVEDPSLMPLALHVDYWDYIGWKDKFAQPKFTERQKAYARAAGTRTIYTPQVIVGGLDRVEGNDPAAVGALIAKHHAVARTVSVTLERKGGQLIIRAVANPPLDDVARVQLVTYNPVETVDIKRGENAGRSVTYRNIVTSWQIVGEWPGQAPLEMTADATGDGPYVVIVQTEGPAAILAAARLD